MAEVAFYVVICAAVGRLILVAARARPDALAYAGLPLIGGFALGMQLWGYGAAHIPWGLGTLLAPWLVGAAVLWRWLLEALNSDAQRGLSAVRGMRQLDPMSWALLGLTAVLCGTYLVSLVTQPLFGWDALAMWIYKADIFANLQAVDLHQISSQLQLHLDYPPLFPLMVDTLNLVIGRVDDITGKAVNFLFLIGSAGAVYAAVREMAGRRLGIMFMFLAVGLPVFQPFVLAGGYMGYADYALSACLVLSLANLSVARLSRRPINSVMAVLFASMAAMVKNEGLPFLGVVLLVVVGGHLYANRGGWRAAGAWKPLIVVVLCLSPVVAWQFWIRAHGFHSDLASNRDFFRLVRALPSRQRTIDHALKTLPAPGNDYGLMAAAFALAVILLLANRLRFGGALLLVFAAQLGAYDLAYLCSPYDLAWHLSTSLDRLVLQMTPALILLLAAGLAPYTSRRAHALS